MTQEEKSTSPQDIQTVVICGPSGVGKGTIINRLKEELAGKIGFCVSHTTRQPRSGEVDGREYWFTNQEEMRNRVERGEFLEVNEVHGELYGTSRAALLDVMSRGLLPVLDVDVKGARDLRSSGIKGLYVFLAPPSLDQLENRLRLRKTETEASIERRVSAASSEIEASKEAGLFDEVVVNDVLDNAFEVVKSKITPFLQDARPKKVDSLPRVIFILGGPGSGKGTQSEKLVKRFGATHLSAGDLLRAEQATDSSDSQLIKSYIAEGKIVPVEITCRLLNRAMQEVAAKSPDRSQVFLIDGFPRNIENLRGWEEVVGEKAVISLVLFFDCPEEVMQQRLLERGKTSGRADDNIVSIKKRFVTFKEETIPVVQQLENRGLVKKVKADQEIEQVFHDVEKVCIASVDAFQ